MIEDLEDALGGIARATKLLADVEVDDAGVRITVEGRAPGPTLLLASHLDTVPPNQGEWTYGPFTPTIADGKLYVAYSARFGHTMSCELAVIPVSSLKPEEE